VATGTEGADRPLNLPLLHCFNSPVISHIIMSTSTTSTTGVSKELGVMHMALSVSLSDGTFLTSLAHQIDVVAEAMSWNR